jgi:hypothetical protein
VRKKPNNQLIPVGLIIEVIVPGAITTGKKQRERKKKRKLVYQ